LIERSIRGNQAEISQGILQAFFEYQSLIAELADIDVVNASMYDWASALGEAALMSKRLTKRDTFLIPYIIHPERLDTLRTYATPAGIKTVEVKSRSESGQLDVEDLKNKISKDVAGVYIENPSHLGFLETQVDEIAELTHDNKSLFVVGVDPTSLGVIRPPGDYDADIVIGEGQPLGSPMNFGGPLLGIFGCKDDRRMIRHLPGRLIGMTTTEDGKKQGFVMTLSSREQHIRREKATSNICTNEALGCVAAAVYLALLGPEGIQKLGEIILQNSHYAMKKIGEIDGIKTPLFDAPHFKEFTVNVNETGVGIDDVQRSLLKLGIHGGKIIREEFPEFGETSLFCVTEIHTRDDILKLVDALSEIVGGGT